MKTLPPGQQLAGPGKWPVVGERQPGPVEGPWRLAVTGLVAAPRTWTLDELRRCPQVDRVVDVHCVTRWTMLDVPFGGVPLRCLFEQVAPQADARFVSFVAGSLRHHSTTLSLSDVLQLDPLIALTFHGQPLPAVHGGPVRSVVPGRYFYKSVKWLIRVELLAEDRLGFWEGTAGYHNHADPWREERFIASSISQRAAASILARRDVSGLELLGLDGSRRELTGWCARGAVLRNADFTAARLDEACFDGANLSNARFRDADLRGASLVGADLEGADFLGADLRGADLRQASLLGASFAAVTEDGISRAARFDARTRLDPAAIEDLMPAQAEFVRRQLAPFATLAE
jgi:DMSO/TMAO reductase YedYZ molybdopterin-dependent catalytic subunit